MPNTLKLFGICFTILLSAQLAAAAEKEGDWSFYSTDVRGDFHVTPCKFVVGAYPDLDCVHDFDPSTPHPAHLSPRSHFRASQKMVTTSCSDKKTNSPVVMNWFHSKEVCEQERTNYIQLYAHK